MFGGYVPGLQSRVNDVYIIDVQSMVSPSLAPKLKVYAFHAIMQLAPFS